MENENWRDIPDYEGLYQVSNLGNVKSLNYNKTKIEKVLNPRLSKSGYLQVDLSYKNVCSTKTIHSLVAIAFLNHTPCGHNIVIDHVNDIKTDNRAENLQLVTSRFNTCKTQDRYTSNHKGVCWDKKANKWVTQIHINGKQKKLGYFACELKASLAYQNKLKEITL